MNVETREELLRIETMIAVEEEGQKPKGSSSFIMLSSGVIPENYFYFLGWFWFLHLFLII